MNIEKKISILADTIKKANYMIAFTGAGISVESGVPPFRGHNGIWGRYDPKVLDIDFFYAHPLESWKVIREIFYNHFGKATPNKAHYVLGKLEQENRLKCVVTQNIDNLHQEGGTNNVYEFHGNSKYLVCTRCNRRVHISGVDLGQLPVLCPACQSLMKPDFVFFGEGIPGLAYEKSMEAARKADVVLIIGSTGEVMPAAMIPYEAKKKGAYIIEINPEESNFTNTITDLHVAGKAGDVFAEVEKQLGL